VESGDLHAPRTARQASWSAHMPLSYPSKTRTNSWWRGTAPVLLGLGEGENFAASDASALLQVTRRIVYLEEGMWSR
jgi:hypothetical protein